MSNGIIMLWVAAYFYEHFIWCKLLTPLLSGQKKAENAMQDEDTISAITPDASATLELALWRFSGRDSNNG